MRKHDPRSPTGYGAISSGLFGVYFTLSPAARAAGSRLPAIQLSLHDVVRALRVQAGVNVTPGTEFSPESVDSIRLNFSQNPTAAVQAVERIARLIERYRCPRAD